MATHSGESAPDCESAIRAMLAARSAARSNRPAHPCFLGSPDRLLFVGSASPGAPASLCTYENGMVHEVLSAAACKPPINAEKLMTKEEELLRERQRSAAGAIGDVQLHHTAALGRVALVTASGDSVLLVLLPEPTSAADTVASGASIVHLLSHDSCPASRLDCKLSPDGRFLGWISDEELWVGELALEPLPAPGKTAVSIVTPRRLTNVSASGRSLQVDWNTQEEFDRYSGWCWAPTTDGKHWAIAAMVVDERAVEQFVVRDADGDVDVVQNYPVAGGPTALTSPAIVRFTADASLGLADLIEVCERTSGLDAVVPAADRCYVPRFGWLPDGSRVWVEFFNRLQSRLSLVTFQAPSLDDAVLVALEEQPAGWINTHDVCVWSPLSAGWQLLWLSDRSGFPHIYRMALDERTRALGTAQPLTAGDWCVCKDEPVAVLGDALFFAGFADTPLEAHVYCVSFSAALEAGNGSAERHRLTQAGTNNTGVCFCTESGAASAAFLCTSSSTTQPFSTSVWTVHLDGPAPRVADSRATFFSLPLPDVPFAIVPPTPLVLPSGGGDYSLHGYLWRPAGATGPLPTLLFVYGGPTVNLVVNDWSAGGGSLGIRHQLLNSLGIQVVAVDNRGTPHRGRKFEFELYRRMGSVEVEDQVAAVQHLVANGIADAARIGVTGWSYGGYMTLLLAARHPTVFAAAVAGAPVTRWELYDSAYTERYNLTPQLNPEGYKAGSVLTYASTLSTVADKVSIVHGVQDENVHIEHTNELLDAMRAIAPDRLPCLIQFPGARHGLSNRTQQVSFEAHLISKLLSM